MPLYRVDHGGVFVNVIQRKGNQQNPGPSRSRQIAPLQQAVSEYGNPFRVIGHPGDCRTGQHEVPVATGRDVLGEATHDSGHVLELIPPGNLNHQRVIGAGAPFAGDPRSPGDGARAAVAAQEGRPPLRRDIVQHADRGQDAPHSVIVEMLVLRGKRIDRRRYDPNLVTRNPRWHILAATEHVGVRGGQVRPQKAPPCPGGVVFPIHADMAAPRHLRARSRQHLGQPGGLRVVQQNQIPRPYLVEQFDGVRGENPCVMTGGAPAEWATRDLAMDLIVQALGGQEELGITADHPPADLDIESLDVADEHLQHLCHPAADRGRTDIPDGTAGQSLPELVSRPGQPGLPPAADNLPQAGQEGALARPSTSPDSPSAPLCKQSHPGGQPSVKQYFTWGVRGRRARAPGITG